MEPRRALERWMMLMALAVLAGTAWIYPFFLQDSWILSLQRWSAGIGPGWAGFFSNSIAPGIKAGYDTLVLKETVGAIVVLFMLVAYVPWKVLYAPRLRERPGLHAPLILLLGLAAFSVLWSPAPRIAIQTVEALLCAAVLFLMISDLGWGESGRRRLLTAIVCVGAVIAIVATCQVLPGLSDLYYHFYRRPPASLERNVMSSWIGHNTEMASYVLSAVLAAMALWTTTKSRAVRIALTLFLVLATFVIVRAQSRAVWALFLVLGGGAGWQMARLAGRRLQLTHLLVAVVLILLCSLTAATKLRERLHDLTPAVLLNGTRVRIPLCSAPLVAQKPVFGHGIGSFASLYPKAQADYFALHPNSRINQTDLRTPQAHNDYLQLLVELGGAGLALWLVAIFFYARAGERGRQALSSKPDQIQSLAFIYIVGQHSLNALVNFPAHVAPAAYLFAVCGGAWVALGREGSGGVAPSAPRPLPSSRVARVALLVLCLAPLGVAPVLGARFCKELTVSARLQAAIPLVTDIVTNPALTAQQRNIYSEIADAHLRTAQRLDPLNWESRLYLGILYTEMSEPFIKRAQAAQHAGSMPASAKAQALYDRSEARQLLERAIFELKESKNELGFHETFFRLGIAYRRLDSLAPNPETRRLAIENFEQSVRYSGVIYESIQSLVGLLAAPGSATQGQTQRLIEFGRQLLKVNSKRYREDYIDPIDGAIYRLDFDRAAQMLQTAIAIDPQNPGLRYNLVFCTAALGDHAGAASALEEMGRRFGKIAAYWQGLALLQMAQGRNSESLATALAHCHDGGLQDSQLVAFALLLLKHAGRGAEAERVLADSAGDKQLYRISVTLGPFLAYSMLHDAALAEREIQSAIARDQRLGLNCYIMGRIALDRGDGHAALVLAQEAATASDFKGSTAAADLLARARTLTGQVPGSHPATQP